MALHRFLNRFGRRSVHNARRRKRRPPLGSAEVLEVRQLLTALTVNSLADDLTAGDGLVTLREAIDAANNDGTTDLGETGSGADQIVFAPELAGRTIDLTLGTLAISDALTISGLGATQTTIDAGLQFGTAAFRVQSGATVLIEGLRVTGGAASGIINLGELTVENVEVSGNQGYLFQSTGGGVYNSGNLFVIDSVISDNVETHRGAGIYNAGGTVTVTRSSILNNRADSINIGSFAGGGIYNAGGTVSIDSSTIAGNLVGSSAHGGGGIFNDNGSVFISNSTISSNEVQNSGSDTLGSEGRGGGIQTSGGSVEIANSTIVNNQAAFGGGGILNLGGTLTVTDTVLADNLAQRSPFEDIEGNLTSSGHNLIQVVDGADISGDVGNDLIGLAPQLGPLADNGGSTLTHAPLPGSPLIDAGSNLPVAAVDQRGYVRRVDGDGDGDVALDIGAVEFGSALPSEPPVNRAPTATDDLYETRFGQALVVDRPGVLENDADLDGDPLTVVLVAAPVHGTLEFLGDGSFTYTPHPGFSGADQFTYVALDAEASSDLATVVIQVSGVIPAKFFVVDDVAGETFKYDSQGGLVETYALSLSNAKPRGAAASPDGSTIWSVDANGQVHVYDAAGNALGQWGSGLYRPRPEGIATDGDDIWIVDDRSDRVYHFSGGAYFRSGSHVADSFFTLATGNRRPRGITTDGVHLWVVNDGKKDKVFKYSTAGEQLGKWTIDGDNSRPTGITIDPSDVNHVWIVDGGSGRVFEYSGAASRTSRTQDASVVWDLAAANAQPQGIADPPPALVVPETPTGSRPIERSAVANPIESSSRRTMFGQPRRDRAGRTLHI